MSIRSIMFFCMPSDDVQVHFRCGLCLNRVLHTYIQIVYGYKFYETFSFFILITVSISIHYWSPVCIVTANFSILLAGYDNDVFLVDHSSCVPWNVVERLDVPIRGGHCWCLCANCYDFVCHYIEPSRELTGLYSMKVFLALSFHNISTPLTCILSSPDQMKSLPSVLPLPVQRTSVTLSMSYLNLFFSLLSNSNFPVAHSV